MGPGKVKSCYANYYINITINQRRLQYLKSKSAMQLLELENHLSFVHCNFGKQFISLISSCLVVFFCGGWADILADFELIKSDLPGLSWL